MRLMLDGSQFVVEEMLGTLLLLGIGKSSCHAERTQRYVVVEEQVGVYTVLPISTENGSFVLACLSTACDNQEAARAPRAHRHTVLGSTSLFVSGILADRLRRVCRPGAAICDNLYAEINCTI